MEDKIYDIQLYLAGEMTAKEKQAFEEQLEKDAGLRALLNNYVAIENNMTTHSVPVNTALKSTLEQLNKKYFFAEKKLKTVSVWPKIMAAAAILLAVVALFFVLNRNEDDQDLYARYAQHEPLLVQERGNAADSIANKAAGLFNEKNYAAAVLPLRQYLSIQREDQFVMALAIAQIETGNYQDAESQLQQLIENKSAFSGEARWYMVLAALKQGDKQKALDAIDQLPSSSMHIKQAEEIKSILLKN